jgi:hypothetical protein
MNPLYIFLERLTKKLELQADLDVVNKLLIVYFVNVTGIAINLFFAGIFFIFNNCCTYSQSYLFSLHTATYPE